MENYIKKDKVKRLKRHIIVFIFVLLVFIICILLITIYNQIDIENEETFQNVDIKKMSSTVEEIKENDKKIIDVIEEVNKSVVGISKLKGIGDSIFLEEGVSKLGLGTGIIVSENGYILTNEHVSGKRNSTCYITINETGKKIKGTVIWSNSDIDMAIIKINVKKLNVANLGDSDNISIGQTVYAIGNPIGYEFKSTVTSGIISAKDRTIKLEEDGKDIYMEDLIQTDATINPGNSGGPLINSDGEVIGINSVKITSAEGIGFAVPINIIKSVIKSFIDNGKFEEAKLGIYAYDKSVLKYMEVESDKGIYVNKVIEESSAEKAGIKSGDVILSIDDKNLERMCELREYIYNKKPKDIITLEILRGSRKIKLEAVLDKE